MQNLTENSTLSTSTLRTFEVQKEDPLEVSLGIFLAILFGSLAIVFLIIGMCILTHTAYMRYFKKPWYTIQLPFNS